MITATTGLNLNHGWVRGYRFEGNTSYGLPSQEFLDNKAPILIFIIDGVVEFVNLFYAPLATLLLDGQNSIVDMENFTVQVTANGVTETIVFEETDEEYYAILASSPLIIEMTRSCTNNCGSVQVGWKWDGEVFHE
jgi:hypothetical protein